MIIYKVQSLRKVIVVINEISINLVINCIKYSHSELLL